MKTESLDNAILAFSLAQPSWFHGHFLYASVENWKLAEIFFAKDRMAPEENRFNS